MVFYEIHEVTAFELMTRLPDQSVHLVVTDPPYFIDGLGEDWNHTSLSKRKVHSGTVGGLPAGMRFSREQGANLQKFITPIAQEMFRVLKPGGFLISFSQGRLYHRMTIALEDAGFEIRDMLAWARFGQAKAQSQDHHVTRKVRNGTLSTEEGERIITSMNGRKTPQLAPYFEPMALAMKPADGTLVENWMRHQTGLIDTSQSLNGKFPSNLMHIPKPRKAERGAGNIHMTVKPVTLVQHIIEIFSAPGQIVLDPFMGSGSHGIAAVMSGRKFIGCEPVSEYFRICEQRIDEADCVSCRRPIIGDTLDQNSPSSDALRESEHDTLEGYPKKPQASLSAPKS